MKYTYAYKTSDGVRHEAVTNAESREVVFETLKRQGIRPIKVVAADGSKANGELRGVRKRVVFGVVLVTSLLAAVCAYRVGTTEAKENAESERFSGYSEDEKAEFVRLNDAVSKVVDSLLKSDDDSSLNRMLMHDFETSANGFEPIYTLIDNRASSIEGVRKDARRVFAMFASKFSPDGVAIRDVQRLYGEKMSQLDALEIANANRRFALDILDRNRGKWKSGKNGPVFSDPRLSEMYNYCLEGLSTDAATSRWQKDFGFGGTASQ